MRTWVAFVLCTLTPAVHAANSASAEWVGKTASGRYSGTTVGRSKTMRGQILGKKSAEPLQVSLSRQENRIRMVQVQGKEALSLTGEVLESVRGKRGESILKVRFSGAENVQEIQERVDIGSMSSGIQMPIEKVNIEHTMVFRPDGSLKVVSDELIRRGKISVGNGRHTLLTKGAELLVNTLARRNMKATGVAELGPAPERPIASPILDGLSNGVQGMREMISAHLARGDREIVMSKDRRLTLMPREDGGFLLSDKLGNTTRTFVVARTPGAKLEVTELELLVDGSILSSGSKVLRGEPLKQYLREIDFERLQ